MEEDAEGMDRFDMDGDFEGGRFGRDGEFYYERRRERAPQTRDDALYGVFAEGDSDDDAGNRRRRHKHRRDKSEPDLSRPVQFQSAGKFMPSKEPEPELEERPGLGAVAASSSFSVVAAEDDAAEEDLDLPTAFAQRIAEGARARREERARERETAARRRHWGLPPGSRRRLWGALGSRGHVGRPATAVVPGRAGTPGRGVGPGTAGHLGPCRPGTMANGPCRARAGPRASGPFGCLYQQRQLGLATFRSPALPRTRPNRRPLRPPPAPSRRSPFTASSGDRRPCCFRRTQQPLTPCAAQANLPVPPGLASRRSPRDRVRPPPARLRRSPSREQRCRRPAASASEIWGGSSESA